MDGDRGGWLSAFAGAVLAFHACAAGAEGTPQPGLAVDYFGSPRMERPQGKDVAPTPLVDGLGKGNDWAAQYKGLLTPQVDGEHAFRAEADTGVRLVVGAERIVDGWSKDGARTGRAVLAKGRTVPFLVEFFFDRGQGGRRSSLRLFWTPPGGKEEPMPASVFSHLAERAPIVVRGGEQQQVNHALPDGGLKPVAGAHNFQVFRSTRDRAGLADQDGWTYAHHMDLAAWKGRLYAAWAMTPKDEDVPPYKVVYSASQDGVNWPPPRDLFPRDGAWANRFYFYRARNGRMLAFCAGAVAGGDVSEAIKKVLLVREITGEHALGDVYTLVCPGPKLPPPYGEAGDAGFVEACREAAANNLLLEQQDYGVYLGDRRMAWHKDAPDISGWKFGKAFCFYHRSDGATVGLCKMGFATVSTDGGATWSKPVAPPTLIAGGAKVWGQRTPDGRFALVYTPDRRKRYPLVIVHGDDGVEFRDMRVVHGEMPRLRYAGKYKDVGAQYMRGLAEWSDDGTFADGKALWLIYSVNKEDIWVARVPLPVRPDETAFPSAGFEAAATAGILPGWNVYRPRWADVTIVADDEGKERCLELRDRDPADYARAVRLFPAAANVKATLKLKPAQTGARLEIELCDAAGRRPIRVALAEDGKVQAADGPKTVEAGAYQAGRWLTLRLAADLAAGFYTVQVNDAEAKRLAPAEGEAGAVERLSLRTGRWRGCGEGGPLKPGEDVPLAAPAVFRVAAVDISAAGGK